MPKVVTDPGSMLNGHCVRRARKKYNCDGWATKGCEVIIEPGNEYVEGDSDIDRAGGFGHKRYCSVCCQREIAEAELVPA